MTTPVLLCDQDGNEVTVMLTGAELRDLIDCTSEDCMPSELPPDEGLDPATCYTLEVRVV